MFTSREFFLQISYSFTTSSAINRVARQFKFTIARWSSVSRYKWFSKLHTIVKIYSISRGCFCKHFEEDVLESVFECWNRTLPRNDILIRFFVPVPPDCGERLLSRRSQRYFLPRTVFFVQFFFHISILKRIAFYVCRAPTVAVDYVCRMHNAAARSRTAIFSKRFRNQCLESVGYAHGMYARNTFVSNRLN